MPDYGHDIRFGAFVTPTSSDPQTPVGLAVAAEEAGLDLVTFQDHPYQPRFLDTWTLLSYVAARTSRITLAPNVLNLPLRPPAVVARAAASLDLLSGGRFELGIGAGGFWDAIAAMGGPRRSPGEAVEALDEAIGVIRSLWDVDAQPPLRLAGDAYRLDGAKRGPAPAHPVGIWIGAYGPRMLRLVGRTADGWLPSLPYFQSLDQVARATAAVDDAATAAGRDPADILRLMNVGAEPEPDLLVHLALSYGTSVFIAMTDDVGALQRFATEVAPAVREAVAAERARGAS